MENTIIRSEYKYNDNSNVLIKTLDELKIQKFKNK